MSGMTATEPAQPVLLPSYPASGATPYAFPVVPSPPTQPFKVGVDGVAHDTSQSADVAATPQEAGNTHSPFAHSPPSPFQSDPAAGAVQAPQRGGPQARPPLAPKSALSAMSSSPPDTGSEQTSSLRRLTLAKRTVSWADLNAGESLATVKEYHPDRPPASPSDDDSWDPGSPRLHGCACTVM